MITSYNTIPNMHYKPSFGGLAHIFKKRIIVNTSTFRELIDRSQTDFIGNLPPDMIKKICKMTKSKEQKKTIIEEVREIFSKTANTLRTEELPPIIKIPKKYKTSILALPAEIINVIGEIFTNQRISHQATKELTKAFQNINFIKKYEKVKVKYIGSGCFGTVFNIHFPKNKNISDKIIKIFSLDDRYTYMLGNHGVYPETNIGFYIKDKKPLKHSHAIDIHYASVNSRYYLAENVWNYPRIRSNTKKITTFLEKLGLIHGDLDHNFRNCKIFDFGGIVKE